MVPPAGEAASGQLPPPAASLATPPSQPLAPATPAAPKEYKETRIGVRRRL